MSLELRTLRYFVTVAEELHFARAALRLHMTQPPLSQAIAALEQSLGQTLFYRNKRQVSLTPAGQALLPQARHLLAQAESLPQLLASAARGDLGRLSLAFVSTVDYNILPPLLREFRQRHPLVEIELQEATSDRQWQALGQQEIDAGLLIPPLPARLQAVLEYRPVLKEALVLALPSELPPAPALQADGSKLLQHACQLPLIIFPRHLAPSLHDAILTCFRAAGLTPADGQQANQMQTIVSLVAAGLGMALVPQSVAMLQRPGVQYWPLGAIAPLVETGLAWRRDRISPVLQAFLQLLPAFSASDGSLDQLEKPAEKP